MSTPEVGRSVGRSPRDISQSTLTALRKVVVGDASRLPPDAREALRSLGIEPPDEAAERHSREIHELGLEKNVRELEERGYTVVRDAFAPDFAGRMRNRMLEIAAEYRAKGIVTMGGEKGPTGQTLFRLLERGRVFEEAAIHPMLVALMTHVLGGGYTVSTFTGMVRPQGTPELGLHSDNQAMPAPFPEWQQVATAVWCLEDFTREAGATRIVPGSHRFRRHPRPGEGDDKDIAVEAPKGSLLVWVGNTWHGNCARTLPGERVTLHTAFNRMHLRPFESYDALSQEVIDRNPPIFAQIIGRDLPWEHDERGPDPIERLRVKLLSHVSASSGNVEFSQPVVKVKHFAECLRFYRDFLGCSVVGGSAEGPVAYLESGGQRLALLDAKAAPSSDATAPGASTETTRVTFAFSAQDVDAVSERLREARAEFIHGPQDFPDWGFRTSLCRDPDGNPVEIFAPLLKTG